MELFQQDCVQNPTFNNILQKRFTSLESWVYF